MVLNKEKILTIILIILIIGFAGLFLFKHMNNEIVISEAIDHSEEKVSGELRVKNSASEGFVINEFSNTEKNMDGNMVILLEEKIVVHVAGEVGSPGVYELKENARVIDAIVAAGGETQLADLDALNLAAPIYDGEKIYIPSVIETAITGEVSNYEKTGNQYSGSGQNEERKIIININRATAEELTDLPGIGPAKANSIVEHRNKIGKFGSKEELLEVSGIGEKTLANIQDLISVR